VLADERSNTLWACSNDLSALGVVIASTENGSTRWSGRPPGSARANCHMSSIQPRRVCRRTRHFKSTPSHYGLTEGGRWSQGFDVCLRKIFNASFYESAQSSAPRALVSLSNDPA
jgi:hypothetical protein